ncbi:MAG: hypothetical protein ACTSO9_20980 [Candidatus Helarchaeota archaeon]
MTIKLENNIAEELIKYKLGHLQKNISSILERWNENNIEDFLKKAKTGELPEAEMDAITLKQLNADYDRLKTLLKQIREGEP